MGFNLLWPFRWLLAGVLACVVVYGAGYLKGRQSAAHELLEAQAVFRERLADIRAEMEAGELARAGEAAALEAALARELADVQIENDCPLDAADIARMSGQWRGGPR